MPEGARDAFASHFDRLVTASGLQAKTVVSKVNRTRKPEAPWKLTTSVISAWRTGRNLPSGANEEGFFRGVRLLTEHTRGRVLHGQDVGELLDEADWARSLQRARADAAAEHREITTYLDALIHWLHTDPWPTDIRFGGPALDHATLELSRRVETSLPGGHDCDADELADRLSRMVIRGEPGMGKTWFARRSARRCAETALDRLAAGDSLDDVELPLYTTCARLAGMPQGDEIRHAVIRSALSHLPDLGGTRISAAVQAVFQDRNAPTLLVLDSLDEAPGADARIRQADTLPSSWRVLLTTRPAAWNNQLAVPHDALDRALATLRLLSYPRDVEAFITKWFGQQPERAADLIDQLRKRSGLQESAKVPLMLAFYCILGTVKKLPARRGDLYAKVINRMLTGRWRDSGFPEPDLQVCRATLRAWAWTAAEHGRNPVSGTGGWADEFPTPPVRDPADREALSHVAPPTGPADPDTGTTTRQFIHRSVQEHLVAEHVAHMPVPEAAGELLSHLWWDTTWRVPIAAAVTQHPKRDELLTDLIARLTGNGTSTTHLAALDESFEARFFLAQVALESSETDWSSEAAQLIAQARTDIAGPRSPKHFPLTTTGWPNADLETRRTILAQLASAAAHSQGRPIQEPKDIITAACALAQLKPTAAEAQRARGILLEQFVQYAQESLDLRYLAEFSQAIAGLNPTADERAVLKYHLRTWIRFSGRPEVGSDDVTMALLVIEETPGEMLGVLLAAMKQLADHQKYSPIPRVADKAIPFCRGDADREALRTALLDCTSAALGLSTALQLADKIMDLEPAASDRAKMLDLIIAIYERMSESNQPRISTRRDRPQSILSRLAITPREQAYLHERLLGVMVSSNPQVALELAETASLLTRTDAQRRRLQDAVLSYLPKVESHSDAVKFTALLTREDLSPQESTLVFSTLLDTFQSMTDSSYFLYYFGGIPAFARTEQEKLRAREVLLGRIKPNMDPTAIWHIVSALAKVGIIDDDRAYLRQMVLQSLDTETNPFNIYSFIGIISDLALGAEILEHAQDLFLREALRQLTDDDKAFFHPDLMRLFKSVDVTEEQQTALRDTLLKRTAESTSGLAIRYFLPSLVDFSRTDTEKTEARAAIVNRLRMEDDHFTAETLMGVLAELSPTANDLRDARQWHFTPTTSLLAAVRSNTSVSDWIALLQDLAGSQD